MYQFLCCTTPTRNSISQALGVMLRVVHTVSVRTATVIAKGSRVFGGVQIPRCLIDQVDCLIDESVVFNVINWSTQRRHKDETKAIGLESNHNTATNALNRAVTISTLTYPYTAATHTVEYSIQWLLSTQRRAFGASGSPQCNLLTCQHDISGTIG